MDTSALEKLKFPIGQFHAPDEINSLLIEDWTGHLAVFPTILNELVNSLNEDQLNTPYRPDGWTIKQVVHHLTDSHMNSYIRFKLALTEDKPAIRPYYEDRWGELDDYTLDINISLNLLSALHAKWVVFLRTLSPDQLKKKFVHPEHGEEFSLDWNIGNYVWHGNHHYAQIESLLKRMNWI